MGSALELPPEPVGGIDQLLSPGAAANLLRSTGFFGRAAPGEHVMMLAIRTLAGLFAPVAAALRGWGPQPLPANP